MVSGTSRRQVSGEDEVSDELPEPLAALAPLDDALMGINRLQAGPVEVKVLSLRDVVVTVVQVLDLEVRFLLDGNLGHELHALKGFCIEQHVKLNERLSLHFERVAVEGI